MQDDREDLLQRLGMALRQMGIRTVMYHQAVAEKFGMNVTDSRALSSLQLKGRMTAGELADATGLTTGAVTAIIDRLEAAGWVRREADPEDRRKVIIRLLHDDTRDSAMAAHYGPMAERLRAVLSKYNEDELRLLEDFANQAVEFMREETVRLREKS
jgi:DNA-binding MarR family transcriptional regulator